MNDTSQAVRAAVQRELEQQLSSKVPQLPQAPFEHVPGMPLPQVFPDATQVGSPVPNCGLTQQPPLSQRLPPQQGWPSPPQAEHRAELVLQMVFGAVHVAPEQHALSAAPHVPHAPFEHLPDRVPPQASPLATHRP